MQGGYVNDKWVQGGTNPDAYATWHWYLIDVFVYFSHSLVTLPPPCWTNTAHRRGVKVFGTFITEWDEGKLVRNKLLATMKSARMNAERLAELAVDLGFDGWLGQGYRVSVKGNQLTDAPWNNMSCQGFQTCLEFIDEAIPDAIQFIIE
ncbi:hypothetical protein BDE02_08G065800 [Populus trichocarpa]|nr:hypothetical protein BDE02_08G065800 [Populus trichocarpa]